MKFKSTLAMGAISALAAAYSQGAIIAQQDFEESPGTPTLGYTTTIGTSQINTGEANTTGYRPIGATWGVGASSGISFTTDSGQITFAPINTIDLSNVSVSMNLAALALTSGNGLDGPDSFIVSVSPDGGTTFYDQIRVTGAANATWSFDGASGNAGRAYSTSTVTSFTPSGGGGEKTTDGYTNLTVTGLPSVENLVIRITSSQSAGEKWLVDNVVVQTIPEPSAAALGLLGSLVLLRRRR